MNKPCYDIRAIIARNRYNPEGSGLPFVQIEYVQAEPQGQLVLSAEPHVVWTLERSEAAEMPWEEADRLATSIGFPSQVYTVSRQEDAEALADRMRPATPTKVSAQEAYEALEKRHLA